MDLIKKHTAYSCILISKLIREAFIKKKKMTFVISGFVYLLKSLIYLVPYKLKI